MGGRDGLREGEKEGGREGGRGEWGLFRLLAVIIVKPGRIKCLFPLCFDLAQALII